MSLEWIDAVCVFGLFAIAVIEAGEREWLEREETKPSLIVQFKIVKIVVFYAQRV